jgi:phage/plasmid-like protein (TIGR03299 family)
LTWRIAASTTSFAALLPRNEGDFEMAHNIDMTNGRANIAFLGSRNDVWHRLGQEMQAGMTIDQWATAAGLNWDAIKVPAIASLEGARFDHIEASARFRRVEARNFVVRSDTGHPLGYVSDVYQPVQPRDVLDWFDRYIAVDERFQLDVAGSLKAGEIIWATATYRDPLEIAGDRHVARVLMTTTFDGSGATINQGTMTRTVCNNTLNVSLADTRAVVRTRHNTKFDAARVGKELAQIAQGFACYKAVGDALAQNEMAKDEIKDFFKSCLDIPLDAKSEDVSGRKLNQFQAVSDAYRTTLAEGAPRESAWAALNAITRYVDHDRSSRGGDAGTDVARFSSAQFGSGAALKGKAMELLTPRIKDKVAVLA